MGEVRRMGDGRSIDRLTGFRLDHLHLTCSPVVLLPTPFQHNSDTQQSINSVNISMLAHDKLPPGAVCPDVCPSHRPS
jgi:hypothetical protein